MNLSKLDRTDLEARKAELEAMALGLTQQGLPVRGEERTLYDAIRAELSRRGASQTRRPGPDTASEPRTTG